MRNRLTLLGMAIPAMMIAETMPAPAESSADLVATVAAATSEADTTLSLQEIFVNANFQDVHQSSLSLTTISPERIRLHAAAPNYVEMLQSMPGVYATASTGSYGDATLNIRGFKQENIAILLNGIPIQGLTSGSMYWNNWMGLQEATYAVQVQKGMGASMLTDCAMGGAVNIITRRASLAPATSLGLVTNAYGTTKGAFNYSSGMLRGGWSVDLSLAYVRGGGYVECTDVETFSYMLNVSKRLGTDHTLIFTALGSPEQHDQRNTELSAEEVELYGRDYSKNWGVLRGKDYSIGRNHYWKPYFTLQHLYDGGSLHMKNSLYLAIADGGGRSTYSASGASPIINHQTPDGHIDFDAVVAENQANGISKNIMLDYLSGHTQMGAIASADYDLSEQIRLSAGLQYQYYDTWSKMKVLDLLGGDVFQLYGSNYGLGDLIGSAYGRTTHHASGFLQARYSNEHVNTNLGVSVFNGNYRRHNDLTDECSDWAHGWGASVRYGILWHAADWQDLFLNAGFNSRLPYASTFLASSDLKITHDIVNEKNLMAEVGWRPEWKGGGLELSGYIASWRDRTLSVSIANRTNQTKENYLVSGLNALHMGVELTAHQQLTPWLSAQAYAMLASWKWKGEGDAHVYDKYTNESLGGYTIYCDGLNVGDAPQTQLGLQLDAKLPGGFYLNVGCQHNARMYADFEPKNRTNPDDKADSYRFPAYTLLDANIGWEGSLSDGCRLSLFVSGRNLTDTEYIERGTDGANHDRTTFRGYWGQARTVSCGMKLSF